jgi:glucose dehydrogenase
MSRNGALTLLFFVLAIMFAHAQKSVTPKSPLQANLESQALESNAFVFKEVSDSPDTIKSTLRVRIFEKGGNPEPVQGATVLLRRDQDQMLGRVTTHDGRCLFAAVPASYSVRVQMTGLKTIEKHGVTLEAGKIYDLEIRMGKE